MLKLKPSLVIFDCDGVLVDSEPLANTILTRHLGRAGIELSEAQVQAMFRGCSAAMCIDKIAQWLSADGARRFWQTMQAETMVALQQVKPVDGVISVLDLLRRQQLPFCVASAGGYEKMHTTLSATYILQNYAPRLFSAVDVKRSKPAPDLFLMAAAKMGFQPEQCVVVEDSYLGVEAALAAGMGVYWYTAQRSCTENMQASACSFDPTRVVEFTLMHELPLLLGLGGGR